MACSSSPPRRRWRRTRTRLAGWVGAEFCPGQPCSSGFARPSTSNRRRRRRSYIAEPTCRCLPICGSTTRRARAAGMPICCRCASTSRRCGPYTARCRPGATSIGAPSAAVLRQHDGRAAAAERHQPLALLMAELRQVWQLLHDMLVPVYIASGDNLADFPSRYSMSAEWTFRSGMRTQLHQLSPRAYTLDPFATRATAMDPTFCIWDFGTAHRDGRGPGVAGGEGDGRGGADCGRGAQAGLWPAEDRRGSAAAWRRRAPQDGRQGAQGAAATAHAHGACKADHCRTTSASLCARCSTSTRIRCPARDR